MNDAGWSGGVEGRCKLPLQFDRGLEAPVRAEVELPGTVHCAGNVAGHGIERFVLAAVAAGYARIEKPAQGRREPLVCPHHLLRFILEQRHHRADRLSAYGYGRPTTPWLEDFASDGTLFRNAFTPSPWTPPAHASLFTGLLPKNHGLLHGRGDRVVRGVPLLAETLRDAGYETVGFMGNAFLSSVTGLDAGFERLVPLHDDVRGLGTVERTVEAVRTWLVERRNDPERGPRRPLEVGGNGVRVAAAEDSEVVVGPHRVHAPELVARVEPRVAADRMPRQARRLRGNKG